MVKTLNQTCLFTLVEFVMLKLAPPKHTQTYLLYSTGCMASGIFLRLEGPIFFFHSIGEKFSASDIMDVDHSFTIMKCINFTGQV